MFVFVVVGLFIALQIYIIPIFGYISTFQDFRSIHGTCFLTLEDLGDVG